MARTRQWTDQQVETAIGTLLVFGVALAAAIVVVGGIFYLVHNGYKTPENSVFRGEPADLRQITGVFNDALAVRGRGIIQLGILLLILTPVARVTFSVFAFWQQRDRLYVIITLIVLVVLIHSLLATG
ncbi:DUF1634 domain-containing protein [Tolypothrix bouteillei VB521301_2]|uniref:Membrane protein n=1 Tax=Tolypothrix bouteillei VB521301 TaxID=1479485 RepID=A0A0C1R8C6_9CYAN